MGLLSSIGDFLFGAKSEAPPLDVQIKLIADAYTKYGPELTAAIQASAEAQASGDYTAAAKYGPLYADLQNKLQTEYGPKLAASQAASSAVSGNAAAALEQDLIKRYGPETARAILATQEAGDPRATSAKNTLKGLYDTYTSNLSPTLSGSEVAGINRSLAQQNPYQVGSELETVRNAQTFGDAGAAKLKDFGEGAARAASLIPTISSGVQPFAVSTLGRDSSNTSASIVDKLTGKAYNDPGTALGVNNTNQLFGLQNQANAIDATNKDRGFLQAWTRSMAGLSSAASAAGSFSSCWVSRVVFGLTDFRWLEFRRWMLHDAQPSLRNWYLANGKQFASHLANRSDVQAELKRLMMEVIV